MSESETQYTVDLNGKRFELNEDARRMVQERAEREFEENIEFACWWRTATAEDEQDTETVHEQGDPILVIETLGPIVPWEELDQLEVEMESDDEDDSSDAGNGMQMLSPDSAEAEDQENRTHFAVTPDEFEELPSPEGESEDRIPAKRETLDDNSMVMWIPEHPDVEHTWETGEAMIAVDSWVEWNVQQYANQPRPAVDEDSGHDHWESILQSKDCEVVATRETSQSVPAPSEQTDSTEAKEAKDDIGGRFNGDNWAV